MRGEGGGDIGTEVFTDWYGGGERWIMEGGAVSITVQSRCNTS